MRVYYDLHLHSALSPCGDADMTPNNIVNMAMLNGLNVVALTDHNSCLNCPAAVAVARQAGILLIPGMELCTAEEIHMVCLMPDLQSAHQLSNAVRESMPDIQNRPKIFGEQLVMDEEDRVVSSEERLLINASGLSLMQACLLVRSLGGVCFPAHIDKASWSILAVLGEIPPDAGFAAAELSPSAKEDELISRHPILSGMTLLHNSDAHYLEHIADPKYSIEIDELSVDAVLHALGGTDRSSVRRGADGVV